MNIVHYPHAALRCPSPPVTRIDGDVRKVIDRLRDLMYEHNGFGLSAPQIAVPLQVFVMNPAGDYTQRDQERVFINPVLSQRRGMETGDEGCLSFPGRFEKIRRSSRVRIQAYDAIGNAIEETLSGLMARIVQHETDHLRGRLFIDYLVPA